MQNPFLPERLVAHKDMSHGICPTTTHYQVTWSIENTEKYCVMLLKNGAAFKRIFYAYNRTNTLKFYKLPLRKSKAPSKKIFPFNKHQILNAFIGNIGVESLHT